MKLSKVLWRMAERSERCFDSTAHVLRTHGKIRDLNSYGTKLSNVLSFCHTDYLQLSKLFNIETSKSITYNQPAFTPSNEELTDLETKISHFHRRLQAISTLSYDHAIWAVFNSLVSPEDAVIIDAFTRPIVSIAAQASKAQCIMTYRNCDMADLEKKLQNARHCRLRFVVTDGFFELGSCIPPIETIGKLVSLYEPSIFILNDAGNFGVLGSRGQGLENYFHVEDLADILIGGFESSFGSVPCGYITSSSRAVIQILKCSSIAYSRSPSLDSSIANYYSKILNTFENNLAALTDLRKKTQYFKTALEAIGFNVIGNVADHPAVTVLLHHPTYDTAYRPAMEKIYRNKIDTASLAKSMQHRLLARGILVGCPLPPVVPYNGGRLRIDISVGHSYEDLDFLLESLEVCAKGLKGILKSDLGK